MKKVLCAVLTILLLCVCLAGCGENKIDTSLSQVSSSTEPLVSSASSQISVTSEKFYTLTYEVPEDWNKKEVDESTLYYYPSTGGSVMLTKLSDEIQDFDINRDQGTFLDGFFSSMQEYEILDKQDISIGAYPAIKAHFTMTSNDEDYRGTLALFGYKQNAYIATYTVYSNNAADYTDEFDTFLKSIRMKKESASSDIDSNGSKEDNGSKNSESESKPTPSTDKKKDSSPETPKVDSSTQAIISSETTSQRNAVAKAKDYLEYSAFSYGGLISQLEFEKFSHEDAVYGADHSGADWNEQALKKAHSYLDYSSFSYQGLIEQLEFEEFTTEQATYAVDNCGANWNEQAVKKAESYLSFSSFSREELISQLEFEKFTHEQAVYGVEANGL
mgnify:CR=1 FL=1